MKRTKVDYTLIVQKKTEEKSSVFSGSALMFSDRLCGDSAAIEELIDMKKLPIDTWYDNIEVSQWDIKEEVVY